MKALILILISPVMMMFILAGIQTIEWCIDNGEEVPWQAYVLLACVVAWCVTAANISRQDWRKADRFFDKLTDETKDKQQNEV